MDHLTSFEISVAWIVYYLVDLMGGFFNAFVLVLFLVAAAAVYAAMLWVKARPRKLRYGAPLIVEDLSLEGMTGVVFDNKTNRPLWYFVVRNGKKVEISEREYISRSKRK